MRIVVVGYGMAGARLADELSLSEHEVTVLGAEPHPAYNRILLSSVLAGKYQSGDVALLTRGAKARTGVAVTNIDPVLRTVSTVDEVFPYDHLVLATGSQALVPPLPGLDAAFTFRTLDDCSRIVSAASGAASAIVLGGGLLGLEAARGLALRGLRVEVVHAVGHLMERQLDPGASRVLERTLDGLGITVHLSAAAVSASVRPESVEDAASLTLSDGRVLTADLLVVACGVRPETTLAREAGLTVDRGIVVDDRLRTSDPHISAIGDCAQFGATVGGLVAPAWEQARVLARRLDGDDAAVYLAPEPITRLKADGIDLAAMGSLDSADEELSFTDPARGTYARLVIRDGKLTGAVLLGDNPSVGQVIQLFDRRAAVPSDRRALLLGRAFGGEPAKVDSPALMPDAATVCQCNTVTKGQLVRCWRDGARSLDGVIAGTRATTGCGSCKDAVSGIVDWLVAA
ncbi:FAD-dependent oxidoreductase [Catelliglobosispora koreensis]|uniref:FAD-dependent oxidoreductase n=1 Tax=Catelliglobosispora koreensis TaxID=129052 RepID=UPI00037A5EDB|nr:FAD-dependent oxidoreductase [Catelliglobosispora koreensis]